MDIELVALGKEAPDTHSHTLMDTNMRYSRLCAKRMLANTNGEKEAEDLDHQVKRVFLFIRTRRGIRPDCRLSISVSNLDKYARAHGKIKRHPSWESKGEDLGVVVILFNRNKRNIMEFCWEEA